MSLHNITDCSAVLCKIKRALFPPSIEADPSHHVQRFFCCADTGTQAPPFCSVYICLPWAAMNMLEWMLHTFQGRLGTPRSLCVDPQMSFSCCHHGRKTDEHLHFLQFPLALSLAHCLLFGLRLASDDALISLSVCIQLD